jgi:hypothetical protein
VKAVLPEEAATGSFPQVIARTDAKCSQLPKLVAQAGAHGPVIPASPVDDVSTSVAETSGSPARHTRAWPVGKPAIVADCRRLRHRRLESTVHREDQLR